MTAVAFATGSFAGARLQQSTPSRAGRTQLAVKCQAIQEPDSRRKVLGLGVLFAASVAGPAFAETLAKPEVTGGERVKAPKSAPTSAAEAPKPAPTANVTEGGDLVAKLLERSAANKELNDRKRLTTSYANLASSRTVADGTCTFPNNLFGCDNRAVAGKVPYISDDKDIECKGKPDGKCGSEMQAKAIPFAFGAKPGSPQ